MIETRTENLEKLLSDILSFPSVSKSEIKVARFVTQFLHRLKIKTYRDRIGNVIGYIPGKNEPILLNAHLDRVPPGKGHRPLIKGRLMRSDGSTNLGADDSAGVALILEAVRDVIEKKLPHPPIILAFTVQEEIGLWGAKALKLGRFKVKQGIVYDNACEAGVVVDRGAAYIAFDAEVRGKEIHPGKDLAQGANALKIFQEARLPLGERDRGETRINIGKLVTGNVRNVVPGSLTLQGEIRSFLRTSILLHRVRQLNYRLTEAAKKYGGTVEFVSNQLARSYTVGTNESLMRSYRETVESRGGTFQTMPTFIASDANALRELGYKVFVISTGVVDEHTTKEKVNLADLEILKNDLVRLLTHLGVD